MTREPFLDRVRALKNAWLERRTVARLWSSHTFDAQAELLHALYGWATEAVQDIRSVYGDGLPIDLTPPPSQQQNPPSFSVILADRHVLTLALSERYRRGEPSWHINVWIAAGAEGGTGSQAGPDRRNGHWTRSRLEDVLLSVLGAYERGLPA